MFRQYGLHPPSEQQMYQLYTRFDADRNAALDARECICLADALLRSVFFPTPPQSQVQPQMQPQSQPMLQPQMQPMLQPQMQPQMQPQFQLQQPQHYATYSAPGSQPLLPFQRPALCRTLLLHSRCPKLLYVLR